MALVLDTIWAPAPTTTRGQPTPLSADAKGQRIAYASNKSIFLRSIDDPCRSDQYAAHTSATTVARFAPSGHYVASGDISGTVRVWDCIGEGATKGEYRIISGRINDIAWDGDSQRIIAVGDGKQRFGHCITADSGNSVGEISGHRSAINSVSVRQQRPLRAATASDDISLVFYHGVPYRFNTSLRGHHDGFVYGVAFSPDGARLVSVGADRKMWLYDGRSGEAMAEIGHGEHRGSIFGVSWASDSRRVVTASADRTVKLWDVEAGRMVQSWEMGPGETSTVPHQQVGVVWPAGRSDGLIISLGLGGDLSYCIDGQPRPIRTLHGQQKAITAAYLGRGGSRPGHTLWTGSYDGRVCAWEMADGIGHGVAGPGHSNQIAGFADSTGSSPTIHSIGWDDTLRTIDPSAKRFAAHGTPLSAQPQAMASLAPNLLLVSTVTGLEVYRDGSEKVADVATPTPALTLATLEAHEGVARLAIGGHDHVVRLYAFVVQSSTLQPLEELTVSTSAITALAFSPNRKYLAVGNAGGKILVYDVDGHYKVVIDRWSAHTARVTGIAWNSESTHAVSGGLDMHLFVWSMDKPGQRIKSIKAHQDGVNAVLWTPGTDQVISVGADAAIKLWKVKL